MIQFALGTFVAIAVGARSSADLRTVAEGALRSCAERIRRGESVLAVPSWVDPQGPILDVVVEPRVESILVAEAARQHVSLERLLSHLVILELAERDRQGIPLRLV